MLAGFQNSSSAVRTRRCCMLWQDLQTNKAAVDSSYHILHARPAFIHGAFACFDIIDHGMKHMPGKLELQTSSACRPALGEAHQLPILHGLTTNQLASRATVCQARPAPTRYLL